MIIKKWKHLYQFQIMNPASPEDSGLIYNYNAEDGVGDKENNVKEELVCDIKIEEVEFTTETKITTK